MLGLLGMMFWTSLVAVGLLYVFGQQLLDVDLRIITRKELQRMEREANEALEDSQKDTESAMANFIFHELRNDQNALSGFLTILADDLGKEGGGSTLSPALGSLLQDARLHAHHAKAAVIAGAAASPPSCPSPRLMLSWLALPLSPFASRSRSASASASRSAGRSASDSASASRSTSAGRSRRAQERARA